MTASLTNWDFASMIICEIGLNHLGDTAYADGYLNSLIEGGADAVTFQVPEPAFFLAGSESLRLPDDYYAAAFDRLQTAGLKRGIALADINKVDFFESLNVDFYKVLSKDFLNHSLVGQLFATGKPVYLSTGRVGLDEIRQAVKHWSEFASQLRFIHTQLSYDPADVNLKVLTTMKTVGAPVAFGSHAKNQAVLYAAVAFEPSDIFFYIKGDAPKHPDEDHAIPLSACPAVIANLRELALCLGDGQKNSMENLIA